MTLAAPRHLVLVLLVAAAVAAGCAPRAQTPAPPVEEPVVSEAPTAPVAAVPPERPALPRFEDFPATESFAGTPARVDLASQPWASLYRTMLREGAAEGPNFAGAYTLVSWGCGTQCQQWAVVDARTGRVHGFPFDSGLGVDFRPDSRLVVVNPLEPGEDPWPGRPPPAYFAWDGRQMVRIPTPPPL